VANSGITPLGLKTDWFFPFS